MRHARGTSIGTAFVVSALALAGTATAHAVSGPDVIPLPDGFRPEGIASGAGTSVYAGSLGSGDVVRANLRTGEVDELVDAPEGRIAVGLKVSTRTNQLVVAGGPAGEAYFYDARTGDDLGSVLLNPADTFINDVALTTKGAWFTDSRQPRLYFVPIDPDGSIGEPATLELSGPAADILGAFNLNGIAASPDGSQLIVAHSSRSEIIAVDPLTGNSRTIDLGGAAVPNADGILLDGPRLWVVQNQLNQVAEIRLAPDWASATIVSMRTSDAFDVPTTIARQGASLAAVNARFSTTPTPQTSYDIVVIDR